jgi:aquaporin Z
MKARTYLAELLGTFLFMMIGYASVAAISNASAPTPNLLVVPFSFGFGLLAAIFSFGHISGGHFNPAVTVAMVLDKRTPAADGVGYILAQIIGAIGAAAVVLATVSQDAVAAGITQPGAGISDVSALVLEIIFTAIFLLVILISSNRSPGLAALAIPLTLVGIHFAIATLSGSSVNPARSIGSALVGGDLSKLWIYIVGPVIGGIIGYGIYKVAEADIPAAAERTTPT